MFLAASVLVGCASPPRSYTAKELDGASQNSAPPPSEFLVLPGRSAPQLQTIGNKPADVVAFQIQMSADRGQTWADAFGSPIDLTNDWYSIPAEKEGLGWDVDQISFRARWVFSGPSVTPWSGSVAVKTAGSVSGACSRAMQAAAAVPAGDDNNTEIRDSLDSCENMEQWVTALYLYPQAMIYNYLTLDRINPGNEVSTACSMFPDARACANRDLGVYQ